MPKKIPTRPVFVCAYCGSVMHSIGLQSTFGILETGNGFVHPMFDKAFFCRPECLIEAMNQRIIQFRKAKEANLN